MQKTITEVKEVFPLVVAIFTLFLPYIVFEVGDVYKKYYLMSSIYIAAYYILKSVICTIRNIRKYKNSISY